MKNSNANFALALAFAGSVLASTAIAQSASAPAAEAPKPAASAAPAAAPAAPTPAPAAVPAPRAPAAASTDTMSGTAAWYGRKFNGRKTASGQVFNAGALTAAHPSLAFGSRVKVSNTKNKRSVTVVINDRGPTTPGRIIDVTQAAAQRLGFVRTGTAPVTLEVVGQAPARKAKRA